jgi:three-Cys-motif partner protein
MFFFRGDMKTTQRKFGNASGTLAKLETIFNYANFYTTILKDKPKPNWKFRLTYIDAFAGAGRFPIADELPLLEGVEDFDTVVEGSALRSLKVDNAFDHYIFSDIKQSNIRELEELRKQYPIFADRIEIVNQNANDLVARFCANMTSQDRALMFLDPFGNQVNFDTLRIIAETKKIDLFYLFPSWWGVVRQVSNDGSVLKEAEESLTRVFGTSNWRSQLTRNIPNVQTDMFNQANDLSEKIASVDSVTRYMIERMKTIFGDGVSEKWLPLGRNGSPGYSLIFACANDAKTARPLAKKVAREIMKRD